MRSPRCCNFTDSSELVAGAATACSSGTSLRASSVFRRAQFAAAFGHAVLQRQGGEFGIQVQALDQKIAQIVSGKPNSRRHLHARWIHLLVVYPNFVVEVRS